MIFNFPKPVKKKTIWIEIPVEMWDGIEAIMTKEGITQEQVLNTFLTTAWDEYCKSQTEEIVYVPRQISDPEKLSLPERNKAKEINMQNQLLTNLYLDKAAYLMLYGAILIGITGEGHNARFTLEVPVEVWVRIKQQPLIDYKLYMKRRKKLKIKSRNAFGL